VFIVVFTFNNGSKRIPKITNK